MSLRQFEYFLAVAETGSLTAAATRLSVAQPSLSQQLKELERRAGGPLFERLPRGVRLTHTGRAFLPEAQAAVRAAERAYRAAREAATGEAGEIVVATVSSVATGILPTAIRAWRDQHTRCPIHLHEFSHRDLLEQQVRKGLGDLAAGPRPPLWDGPVISLGYEEFVLVLPHLDPLLEDDGPVALDELADRDWVLFGDGHGLNELIAGTCAAAGFEPTPSVRTWQVDLAARLAASGMGVALLPDNAVPSGLSEHVRRCRPRIFRELTCYLRTEPSGLVRELVPLLQSAGPGLKSPPDGCHLIDR